MRVLKTYNWSRRDFSATMECEGCNATEEHKGCYDDRNFYDNVIPTFVCKNCGKSRNDLDIEGERVPTKYASTVVI